MAAKVHNSDTIRPTVGYIRVSTEEQARDGVSLAAQEERIRAFCVATARELRDVIVDNGVSAKNLKREGIQCVLAQIRAREVGGVIVLKLDRLTRSVRDLLDLLDLFERHAVALVSINETLDTSSAMGRCIIKVISSFSELEREQIGERTSFALSHLRRAGKVYGQVPYGWTRQGDRLILEPHQQEGLRIAREMSSAGASLRQIATALAARGIKPQCGKAWHAETVRSLLTRRIATDTMRQ